MAGVLETVNQRTQLVGQNRLELLMFHLTGGQTFAINVFKVQEVIAIPELNEMPKSHPFIAGVTNVRGQTVPVIDLRHAIGMGPIDRNLAENLIVTEYNKSIQAFLVGGVHRIVNLNWEEILPPPTTAGDTHFLTAITKIDDKIVEVVDVEKVLALIVPPETLVAEEILDSEVLEAAKDMEVLIVDDSSTALSQMSSTLEQLNLTAHVARDGYQALTMLQGWADEGIDVSKKLAMVITDAEMPEMDGYRLTSEIRADSRLADLFVVLHTSLSGRFNESMVKKVGCDGFLSKFNQNALAETIQDRLRVVMAMK
ncbi:MAG: chemotaxis protein CheV [Pseudomonadales bacterium]|nr:chemotaxis protein CheV [Pseudomonadales bacterium]